MKKLKDKPAFPSTREEEVPLAGQDRAVKVQFHSNGMTLREYYAGLAMQGLLANKYVRPNIADINPTPRPENAQLMQVAVQMADALIAELEKQEEG
jgi:hypothetical protein